MFLSIFQFSNFLASAYRGQMPWIQNLILKGDADIGPLIADPPTTTLQRIKAMTTGELICFIAVELVFICCDISISTRSFPVLNLRTVGYEIVWYYERCREQLRG